MRLLKILSLLGFLLLFVSGCSFVKPTSSDDTTQDPGSNAWWNNRMDVEQTTSSIDADRPGDVSDNTNAEGSVGLQP